MAQQGTLLPATAGAARPAAAELIGTSLARLVKLCGRDKKLAPVAAAAKELQDHLNEVSAQRSAARICGMGGKDVPCTDFVHAFVGHVCVWFVYVSVIVMCVVHGMQVGMPVAVEGNVMVQFCFMRSACNSITAGILGPVARGDCNLCSLDSQHL
jgi:hypothetical protein